MQHMYITAGDRELMIRAENLYKSFDGRAVLNNISLYVAHGEFVSIMGKSGSGKSTLLNILGGNLLPDSGYVLLNGENLYKMKDSGRAALRRTRLGFVYQSLNLISTLNGRDNILLPLYLNREKIRDKEAELKDICELLDIQKVIDKFPSELSGGERQRIAIARALIHSPEVIMLDEPTGSLDSKNAHAVMELLSKINRERGVSIIQVTHDREAASVGNRIVELRDGGIA